MKIWRVLSESLGANVISALGSESHLSAFCMHILAPWTASQLFSFSQQFEYTAWTEVSSVMHRQNAYWNQVYPETSDAAEGESTNYCWGNRLLPALVYSWKARNPDFNASGHQESKRLHCKGKRLPSELLTIAVCKNALNLLGRRYRQTSEMVDQKLICR